MALVKLIKEGYGQLELNNVAFRRDGRIEAQCKLDDTDFANIPAENGMLLVVDNVTRTVKLPGGDDEKALVALHYSAEHLYDERARGLKDFKLDRGTFLPRLGYLAIGDKFTTNAVVFNVEDEDGVPTQTVDQALAALKENLKTGKYYAGVSTQGYIQIASGAGLIVGNNPCLQVVAVTTMPDGQPAIKFQVVRA